MATADALDRLLRRLRQTAEAGRFAGAPDAELLERFRDHKDAAAFEALVRRHGPLVLSACRKVLTSGADVEDAFQATFLILLRNAPAIRKQRSVGSWLYGVAHHVAVQARDAAARRRRLERRAIGREADSPASLRAPTPDLTWRDACSALHEELDRLPEKYRLPLLLCYLEGLSRDEAARRLGWSLNAVRGRLERGRNLLRGRLARRGLALSAGLLAGLGDSVAASGLPPRLLQITLQAATGGRYPPAVAALLQGAPSTMFTNLLKLTAGLVLAAGLLAGAVSVRNATVKAAPTEPPADKVTEKPLREKETVTFSGRVVDPDGKPVAGARLFVVPSGSKKTDLAERATTGEDGRFRVSVPATEMKRGVKLVAAARGLGPDWVEVGEQAKPGEVTLRLASDDLAINGRLLNLEGRGVAGAVVEVRRIEKRADGGDLALLIATKQQWARGNHVTGAAMKDLGAEALPMATSATTDADGRFRLIGFGRERVVHLKIHGKTIETAYVEVLTHSGRISGLDTGNENDAAYGATFERVCAPSKPIVGTVREKGTSKPVAGVRVSSGWGAARTDARGQYRIDGTRKQSAYALTAGSPPYFSATKSNVADTPGFEPVTVDFDLERGLAIRGRVLDKKTGKPVPGTVQYHAFADNPHLKRVSDLSKGGYVAADGSFSIAGLPGPGVLSVLADEDDYMKAAPAADWNLVPGVNTIPGVAHAFVRIDPSEKDPRSATFEIALEPAASVKATVVGTDGKPCTGYYVAGLTASPRDTFAWAFPRASSTFTVRGLQKPQSRMVVVLGADKKCGKAQMVRADDGPLQLRLEPLSSLTGRVVDAGGSPCAGLYVRALLSRKWGDPGHLPLQFHSVARTWAANLQREGKTDAEGKFQLEGILRGLEYTIEVRAGDAEDDRLILRREGVAPPAPGRTEGLGDLRSKQGRKLP